MKSTIVALNPVEQPHDAAAPGLSVFSRSGLIAVAILIALVIGLVSGLGVAAVFGSFISIA